MDFGPTVPQPIFEVVRPPKLVSWDHASLVSWYREWDHYVTKIHHRCAVTGESFERVVATLKCAIQPKVLDIISSYILQRPPEAITNNAVLQVIQTRSQTLVNELVPDVTSLVPQSLHMNLQTDDYDTRILRYFQDFTKIVEENGLQGLIGKFTVCTLLYRWWWLMDANWNAIVHGEEELLLGKDILGDLGINVDGMLAQLAHGADFVDDSDDSEIGDNSQELPAPEDVQINLDHLTSDEFANEMDVEHVEDLMTILNQYPDGRRNHNALNVEISWMEAEQAAFSAAITAIRHSALMTFPTEEDELCVFCDAILSGYSIVVTMVHTWDVTRPVEDQDHSLVIGKGGMFRGAQLNWPIIEKEAFPIIKTCTELEYLLLRLKEFRLYCDHPNLIYLFTPSMDVQEHVRDRPQRWSLRLLGLHYTIEHISGEKNL
ncbi:hypothetical protein PHMEG_00017725 [Phytophthora megakarya]|uniref:Reverse transcriptase RNase H-like domain-containing protein n=1 Tax=Phytophthora megakarya TaxID=4795 RepID=A0A225VVV0_9STRA|nr:hypothetical protein PHMEG_00017725 [Phytophthora megakarya]